VGTKCLQNETVRVKCGFGSEVGPYWYDKPTNAHFQMCICWALPSWRLLRSE